MAKNGDQKDRVRIFRALSAPNRLQVVRLLGRRPLCVGALSNLLGVSPGAVSQHLRVLRDAGLVEATRRGYFIHYHVAPGALKRCREALESLFNPGKGGRQCAAGRRSVKGRRR